ncbi:hypothetical protein [Actinocorallia aurea]
MAPVLVPARITEELLGLIDDQEQALPSGHNAAGLCLSAKALAE